MIPVKVFLLTKYLILDPKALMISLTYLLSNLYRRKSSKLIAYDDRNILSPYSLLNFFFR